MGNSEERHVFDVRIVFGGVGDDVMDIMISLLPTDGKAA